MIEQAGHQIAAIVTQRPAVRQWAAERGILVLRDAAALCSASDLGAFDYLFSITNLTVLPDAVLTLPKRAAINFHDGPLPEYAGLNTPVWALLAGAREYGITWHLMTAQVDQGAVLSERRFEVDEDETAFSLNTKCFQAGIQGFEELLARLDADVPPALRPGAPPRAYFGRTHRPPAACLIDWSQDAAAIARLVRALDFGGYANPVGSAKAAWTGQPLRVLRVQPQAQRSGAAPGTLLAVGADGLSVATGTQDLLLLQLETLQGQPLSPEEASARLGLAVGGRFDPLPPAEAVALGAFDAAVCSHEAFWSRRLQSSVPCALPYASPARDVAAPAGQDQSLPATEGLPGEPAERLLALLLGYLARLGDCGEFDVGYRDAALGAPGAWFSPWLPLRATVDFSQGALAQLEAVRSELAELHRRGSFALDLPARVPELRALASARDLRVHEVALTLLDNPEMAEPAPGSALTIALARDGRRCRWLYDAARLPAAAVAEMQAQLAAFIEAAVATPRGALAGLPLCSGPQRDALLAACEGPAAPWRSDACVHRLIAEQAAQTPQRPALTCAGESISYAELERRANQLARRLAALGVGPDRRVGLCLERSIEMVVALLAIHKAGGAYVPLDPAYPRERIAYMLEDARVAVLLTQQALCDDLPRLPAGAALLCIDTEAGRIAQESPEPYDGGAEPQHLAYVIYTSGSTGRPKGVMVEHRNVVNFFAGIDAHLGADAPGTWLAVTSLSFDISVLELCWTLARGYTVVIATEAEQRRAAGPVRGAQAARPLDFSLFYFASDEAEGVADKYRLLMEGAKYADQHGFAAVWTPERHFHAFGGLYPNPAVASAAIAAVTERIGIRAGSLVLPLHHPIRAAEDWALVDNLSKGRVGVSFAAGWQPNDFVLRPENYADNKNIMLRDIEVVRRLWRGEKLAFPGPLGGQPVEVGILPRPVQKELPFWVTAAGNPATFVAAGKLGARMLTHLLGQTVEELQDKLAAYRQAYREAGHPGEGHVTLMLHSFVGPDAQAVREKVRGPLIDYLRSSANLIQQYAWSFPAFKKREGMDANRGVDLQSLSAEEMDALLEHSFERYFETSGLFGTPDSCLAMIDRIKAIGVDEVACLIDFGIDSGTVLEHLPYLNQLRKASTPPRAAGEEHAIPALLRRHGVTHLQCTPSMARMLSLDEAARPGLAALRRLMVGGEAFPPTLAAELKALMRGGADGALMNMYGPTETTIWSVVAELGSADGLTVPLGCPLVNQAVYLLDSRQQPVPDGVPGELVIGGYGVVRGYLHRPELTAERFLPQPFGAPGRVYRTGDLARRRADGTLEFLGRFDHQVKVRGYRIELGEIEAALLAQPGVAEAVVLAREDVPGDVRLVAYLVARGAPPAVQALREALRAQLPDFMVPAQLMWLAALPQTPNGKVDRRALPAPAPDSAAVAAPAAAYIAPTGELEQQIAEVWKQVLKLAQVGTRDNFFDLGGHSLLAVQAHRQLREALARELSITDIFRFPTIASLAAYLGEGGDNGAAAQQGTDRAQGRRAALARRQTLRQGQAVDSGG